MKNLGVDIIYILNRPQDLKRKERVLEELKSTECDNYEIIKSVTGDRINSIPELIKKKELFPVFTDPVGLLTKNIIATCYTHYKAVEKFYKSDYNTCLILEDDFKFVFSKEKTNKKINNFLNKFNNNFDAIHLSHSYWDKKENVDKDVCRINSVVTASGYIVNNNGKFYDKLIKDLEGSRDKLTDNMKDWLNKNPGKKRYQDGAALNQHWGGLQRKSKWYMFNPPLGKQSGSPSTIMGQ